MADGMERRDFLKVLGVAGGGAALSGCAGGEPEKLIPYVVPPENIVPGVATWYRTTCRECPAGCGMEIRTREGRAVKAEGNPLSPISHGKLCARGQASLHGLYDPDRIPQALLRDGEGWERLSWDRAERQLAEALRAARGRAVFLTGTYTGTLERLIDDFCSAAGVTRVRFDAFGHEPIRAANQALFGIDAVPVHDFANAEVVVSFGADFMETWVSPVDYAHGYVQAHAVSGEGRGTHIAVTPHQSLTSLNADEWLAVRPGTEHLVALAMARSIADRGGQAGGAASLLAGVDINAVAEAAGVPADRIHSAARRFANNGRSVAVGPGVASTNRAATATAAAVAILNSVAGNIGRTVRFDRTETAAGAGRYADLRTLVDGMAGGQVDLLMVYGPNPLYSVPLPEGAAEAMAQVRTVVSFSPYLDETSERAHMLLPDHHFLESWGDHEPRSGVNSLVQPVMTPVFRTKQTGDVLLSVARRAGLSLPNAAPTFYEYLRSRWQREVLPGAGIAGATFEDSWRQALKRGVVVAGETTGGSPSLNAGALGQMNFGQPEFTGDGDFYLVVYPSYRFYDGSLANRPWLQELPDPVSKVSWTSWVEVSPATAERMDLDVGHVLEVTTPYGSAELPVFIHPGVRDDTIAVQLGQGHSALGRYATDGEDVRGVNAAKLIGPEVEAASGGLVWSQVRASIRPTGDWEHIPITGRLDEGGRHIVATTTMDDAIRHGRAMDLAAVPTGAEGAHAAEAGVATATAAHGATDAVAARVEAHDQEGPIAGGGEHDTGEAVHPMEQTVRELQGAGGFAPLTYEAGPQEYPPPGTYYGEYTEAQPRWGMAIDMERCIGCSACMTACYAENNIGIVGPELVAQGRMLQWIRIERYFEQDEQGHTTGVSFLPMMCQQCGNAPCEPVCPVYASYHTPDGLNGQVYNRCVGTRYCANNCPYKVRYFNYFSYEWPEPLNWQLNPDVTVREKGVMEKCTFCVQRIREKERQARLDDRPLLDGEITPACAQTCPGDAIVFGNLRDPGARVTRIAASGRGYRVLDELNTQSAVTYLKKVVPEGSEA